MLRLLVTGSRTWDDAGYIRRVLDGLLAEHGAIVLYHGDCPTGADAIADRWAREQREAGYSVLTERFPAQWDQLGRAAGMARNREMVATIGAVGKVVCHAFIRDNSRGASHCASHAQGVGIPTTVHRWERAAWIAERQREEIDRAG